MSDRDLSKLSMRELFGMEVQSQAQVLTSGLLALEINPQQPDQLEICMRAAHSLKGAARIVDLQAGVSIAHFMEDRLVAAQRGKATLGPTQVNLLLEGVDLFRRMGSIEENELEYWQSASGLQEAEKYGARLTQAMDEVPEEKADSEPPPTPTAEISSESGDDKSAAVEAPQVLRSAPRKTEHGLRVSADTLDRLLGQAGELKVESRWLAVLAEDLLRLKRMQHGVARSISTLGMQLQERQDESDASIAIAELQQQAADCESYLSQRLSALEAYEVRSTDLSHRIYDEALGCRMRPFADAVGSLPRMVRDLGVSLGKPVHLEIVGEATQVDRDILDKLQAPLVHLLRNAVDHGIEPADRRRQAGKAERGLIRLEARHSGGLLEISVSDDGCGVDLERMRAQVVERGLASQSVAHTLTETELLDFLFLPGFTLAPSLTDVSGRGVGLDVVREMMHQVRGIIRVETRPRAGTCFRLQLPLTLSVVRSLLVEVAGEAYALPLAHIGRTLKVTSDQVRMLEGRPHFTLDGRDIGLVSLAQVMELEAPALAEHEELSVLLIGEAAHDYALVVDRLVSQRDLVVHKLDPRFGKLRDISAGAILEDGSAVLIIDLDDLLRSIERLVAGEERLSDLHGAATPGQRAAQKRVLVVEDSLTVRELERKLLESRGFLVEVAVDGMDGWNALRTGQFDLVVTDIDMPRMDGIELVRKIRSDPRLRSLLVMVVSYKDREDDRQRGLEAGADHYLTKSSFHEDTLLQAVEDLIGEARE